MLPLRILHCSILSFFFFVPFGNRIAVNQTITVLKASREHKKSSISWSELMIPLIWGCHHFKNRPPFTDLSGRSTVLKGQKKVVITQYSLVGLDLQGPGYYSTCQLQLDWWARGCRDKPAQFSMSLYMIPAKKANQLIYEHRNSRCNQVST